MKKLLLVKTHSVIDIITNSSSEMFICDTHMTIDLIEELIGEMLQKTGNMDEYKHYAGYKFDDCFRPIYTITEDNVDNFIQDYVIDWGLSLPAFDDAGIPKFMDRFEYEKVFAAKNGKLFKYPWLNHQAHNNALQKEMDKARKEYVQQWLKENKEKVCNILIGHVVIESADDNSIPFTLFENLEDLFNGLRFHLG